MEDLFFRLPIEIRRNVFHFTEEREQELYEKISDLINPDKSKNDLDPPDDNGDSSSDESSDDDCDHDKYCAISKFGLTQLV